MKPFLFKQFSIQQSKNVFRVGTDGVLLGALVDLENAKNILEVGTGTGLISLMMAQRQRLPKITAVDISAEAVIIAGENFKNSPFQNNLKVELQDLNKYIPREKFDLIVSNPPYFKENSSQKDVAARQQTSLSFDELISKSSQLLTKNGKISVIIPYESGEYFEAKCLEVDLHLSRKVKIIGIENAAPKRWVLEFGFTNNKVIEEELVLEKSPRVYSDQYLELTREFHLFE